MSTESAGRWASLARERSTDVGTCWIWQGAIDAQGYAKVRDGKRTDRLHHLVCREVHQPAKGTRWVARHLCGCKSCVNPEHVKPGSQRQNRADDRQHERMAVVLPDLDAVKELIAKLPDAGLPALTDAELCRGQRRERLILDQTMRGGDDPASEWFRQMAGYVCSLYRTVGMVASASNDDVLLLTLIARKKRQLAGKPEPQNTGLLSQADIDGLRRLPRPRAPEYGAAENEPEIRTDGGPDSG